MKRELLTELGLEKEVVDKVLNKHNEELAALRTQITTKDTEIATLRGDLVTKNTRVAELEKVDVEALQNELGFEKAARTKDRRDFALKGLLSQHGCKDLDYVLFKLGETVAFDEKDGVKNPDDLLKTAKETYASMFEEAPPTGGTGSFGNFPRKQDAPPTPEAYSKMTYADKVKLKTEQPEAFSALKAAQTEGGN